VEKRVAGLDTNNSETPYPVWGFGPPSPDPDTKTLDALLASLNGSAERFQTLWFSFLGLTLYLAITALTTTHRNLLLGEAKALPILRAARSNPGNMARPATLGSPRRFAPRDDEAAERPLFFGQQLFRSIPFLNPKAVLSCLGRRKNRRVARRLSARRGVKGKIHSVDAFKTLPRTT
jgi:hypothetical protein